MYIVFSASELLCSHVLSMRSCWKTSVCISFLIFYPNFTCHLMHMVFSDGELLPSHELSTCYCWKCIYFSSLPIFLPKSHLSSSVHGILSGWVVAFSCIKYMLLLKVNVFLLLSNLYPISTCSLMHMVFSGGELLPSRLLSTCICWKYT